MRTPTQAHCRYAGLLLVTNVRELQIHVQPTQTPQILFFPSTTVENPLPCILKSASAQSPGDNGIRLRANPGQLPGCVCPHYTSEKSLATTWHLAAQLVTSQGLLPPKSPRENRLVLP